MAGVGRRDSASAWSAAAPRCVASLLACCARKRFAFPQLRTLAGSNPSALGPKKKGPHSWEPIKSVVGDEGCRVRLTPPALASGLRPSRASLENACAFPQLRTLAGSNPMHWAQTKTVPFRGPFPIQWWAMRDSNPQPCACKAPALTVAPIARAERV